MLIIKIFNHGKVLDNIIFYKLKLETPYFFFWYSLIAFFQSSFEYLHKKYGVSNYPFTR